MARSSHRALQEFCSTQTQVLQNAVQSRISSPMTPEEGRTAMTSTGGAENPSGEGGEIIGKSRFLQGKSH